MHKRTRGESGFTLIEVMIATGLLALVLSSMVAVLSDYSQLLREARETNVLMTLRRQIIQNLNRREAWIVTYRAPGNTFDCLLDTTNNCTAGRHDFTLYSGRKWPPSASSVVFSTKKPPTYTAQELNYGLTIYGGYCNTFNQTSSSASALRCPVRLRLTWELLSFGVPSPMFPEAYYPTGYFPEGYYEGTGISGGAGYFPGSSGDYWWFGTLGAQVLVKGTFTVNENLIRKKVNGGNLRARINPDNYDFSIIKEVP